MAEQDKTTEASGQQLTFSSPKLRVDNVVVYLDRAEVCRSFTAKVKEGQQELIITDLPHSIEEDSVRVEGKGSATIAEVSVKSKYVGLSDNENAGDGTMEELQQQLDALRLKESVLKQKQERLEKQRQVLNGFADNVSRTPAKTETATATVSLTGEILESMAAFFDMFDNQASKLDAALHESKQETTKVKAEIDKLVENMHEKGFHPTIRVRELSVILDCNKDEEIEMFVSYIVYNASWTPQYDIRVFGNEGIMKILYYGMIEQSSGEDWDDTKLSLSTATPSVGGSVPKLEIQKISFKPKYQPPPPAPMMRKGGPVGKMMAMPGAAPPPMMDGGAPEMFACAAPAMDIPMAGVVDSIATTKFEVVRPTTIPSDSISHKVSIAIIDLKPTFEYECIPRKATQAYLTAKACNTSQYALLSGPTSIFLDNNFVAKSELKAVSPQEEFTCSLGVDPAVKVDYRPVQKLTEQFGLLSKSVSTVHKQVTEIKNSRLDTIRILMKDQLPLSTEDKLKVVLLEPTVKDTTDASKPVRLNKNNHVEWDLELKPQESTEVVLKYSVDHPATETVQTTFTQAE